MDTIKFLLSEQNLTDSDITEFQNQNQVILPDNYKKLLKKYNGGVVEGHDDVSILCSIMHGTNTVDSWRHIHQVLENNIPKDLLPFAEDVSDNPICLNIKQDDENYGKVYIIYMDGGDLEPVLMADTLEELFGVEKIEDLWDRKSE